MARPHITTTKQAIDFCTSRRAKIWFDDWKEIRGGQYIPNGISCRVTMKRKDFFGKTILKAINNYISYLNNIEKTIDKPAT